MKPELKGSLSTLFTIALVILCIWIWIGIRIGIWTFPQYDRHVWLVSNIPVAHLLWTREIQAGQNADNLIKEWCPDRTAQFGPG
jgi:hypothetical protein